MGAMAVQSLPDGRQIRALEGTYTQRQMFTLRESGLYVPAREGIMTLKEHHQSIPFGAYNIVNVNGWWRTSEYGFYPKGFEKKAFPIGDKLVYVEKGVAYTLQVPDVPVKVNGENMSLGKAVGMGVIPLEKLQIEQIDEKRFTVSVTSDFEPETDVRVVDIMRPSGWALVDADGYPLKSKFSNVPVPDARYSCVRHSNHFENGSTGWHGSLVRILLDYDLHARNVYAHAFWSYASGVALIVRANVASDIAPLVRSIKQVGGAAAPRDVSEATIDAAEAEYSALCERTSLEKLVAFRRLLDSLK